MRCNIICIHCFLCVLRETMCAGLQVLVMKTMGWDNPGLWRPRSGGHWECLHLRKSTVTDGSALFLFYRRTPPGLFIYIYRGAPLVVIYLFYRAITTLVGDGMFIYNFRAYAGRRIIYVCFRFGHVDSLTRGLSHASLSSASFNSFIYFLLCSFSFPFPPL